MNYKPILFSGPMVRAILEGRKTQTRRMLKLKSLDPGAVGAIHPDGSDTGWIAWQPGKNATAELTKAEYPGADGFKCPYGAIGDVLWVREEHFAYGHWIKNGATKTGKQKWKFIRSDDPAFSIYFFDTKPEDLRVQKNSYRGFGWYKRLARFMPRKYCRIFLQIEDIRVERLQDISQEDAKAEGALPPNVPDYMGLSAFRGLWIIINGGDSWNSNPWVWVVSFKRIDRPVDFIKDTGGKTDRE